MTDSHRSHLRSPVLARQHRFANYLREADPPEACERKGRPDSKMTAKKDTIVMKTLHGFVISSCNKKTSVLAACYADIWLTLL